jgi:hypothetical protein
MTQTRRALPYCNYCSIQDGRAANAWLKTHYMAEQLSERKNAMTSYKLTDNEIGISIVPMHRRWPEADASAIWKRLHECVQRLHEFARTFDNGCIEIEQKRTPAPRLFDAPIATKVGIASLMAMPPPLSRTVTDRPA